MPEENPFGYVFNQFPPAGQGQAGPAAAQPNQAQDFAGALQAANPAPAPRPINSMVNAGA